jgi:hypothetical protein
VRGALPVILVLSTGCASFSTHLAPRPTAQGRFDLQANLDFIAFTDDDGEQAGLPNIEVNARYGILDTIDVGLKLHAFGVEASSRIAILLSDRFDLGIMPAAGYTGRADTTGHEQARILTFGAPIVAGWHANDWATLIIGAKFHGHYATRERELVFYPGTVAGAELLVSERFALFPELNVLFPYLSDFDKLARPVWQGGVAFQFRFAP